jgi:hypothetical protein
MTILSGFLTRQQGTKKSQTEIKNYLRSDSIVIGMSSDDSFADNKIYQHIGTENLESDARKA